MFVKGHQMAAAFDHNWTLNKPNWQNSVPVTMKVIDLNWIRSAMAPSKDFVNRPFQKHRVSVREYIFQKVFSLWRFRTKKPI